VALRNELPEDVFDALKFKRYHYSMAWGFCEPRSFVKGITQGWKHLWTRYAQAGAGLLVQPLRGGFEGGRDGGFFGALGGGLKGTAKGIVQGLHHMRTSTRRLFTRPLHALRSTWAGDLQGGVVLEEEEGLHEYLPAKDPGQGECLHLLQACKAVLALRGVWAEHTSVHDRPGKHAKLPSKTIRRLLTDLQYSEEVLGSLAMQLDMAGDSESSAGEEDADRPDLRTKSLERRLACFSSNQDVGIPTRRRTHFAAKSAALESEKPIGFEEVAVHLQPHGLAPKFGEASLRELVDGTVRSIEAAPKRS